MASLIRSNHGLPSLLFIVVTLLFSACSTTANNQAEITSAQAGAGGKAVSTPAIEIDGSSTVYPITDAVAKELLYCLRMFSIISPAKNANKTATAAW